MYHPLSILDKCTLPLICPIEGVTFAWVIVQTDHAGYRTRCSPSNLDAIGEAFSIIGVVTRRVKVVHAALRGISEAVDATTAASKLEGRLRIRAGDARLMGGL